MHAKKLPPHPLRRSEPDLSHLQTRKVDAVSSLAAEMMLRQADEEAALLSSQRPTPRALQAAEPLGQLPSFAPPPSAEPSPSPPSLSAVRLSASLPAWSTARPPPARPEVPRHRGAPLAVAGLLLLLLLSAAAAFILAR